MPSTSDVDDAISISCFWRSIAARARLFASLASTLQIKTNTTKCLNLNLTGWKNIYSRGHISSRENVCKAFLQMINLSAITIRLTLPKSILYKKLKFEQYLNINLWIWGYDTNRLFLFDYALITLKVVLLLEIILKNNRCLILVMFPACLINASHSMHTEITSPLVDPVADPLQDQVQDNIGMPLIGVKHHTQGRPEWRRMTRRRVKVTPSYANKSSRSS